MTTIKLKNGSGAPTAGDLVQGEPALDLTNKRLYTENASGTVIEVGTNPTSITTGTITGSGDMAIDTNTLFVDVSANSVGIGTASPSAKLAVVGTTKIGEGAASNTSKLMVNTASGTAAGIQLFQDSVESWIIQNPASSTALTFANSGTERMRLDSAGRLGLGTTSPSNSLTVSSTAGTPALFERTGSTGAYIGLKDSSGSLVYLGDNNGTFEVQTAGSSYATKLAVTSAGNVGIGTTSPSRLLDVNGIAKASIFDVDGEGFIRGDVSGELHIQSGTTATVFRNNANNTEHMRIVDSSGNVGIGTSSPSSVLTVAVDDATGDNGARIAGVTDGNKQLRLAYNTTGNYANIQAIHAGTAYTNLVLQKDGGNVGVGTASPTNAKLEVVAASGEVFRADASGGAYRIVADQTGVALGGNVGIGTFSPSRKLHVADGANTYITANNTAGSTSAILLGAEGGQTNIYSWTSPVSGVGVPLAFTVGSEAMRIDSSGNLLVGQTSSSSSTYNFETSSGNSLGGRINTVSLGRSSSGYPIVGYNCAPTTTVNTYNRIFNDYASWFHFIAGGIDTYTTTATGTGNTTGTAGPYVSRGGTSWTSSSDRRLKDNIEGISYGLEAVKSLNPVSYVRNDRNTGATELGFIAQEVDEVVSEVVSVKDDGYYGIDYERLIPVLTKAIQDQQEIIDNLKSRIEQLEGAN
jgi:hypothetical protein